MLEGMLQPLYDRLGWLCGDTCDTDLWFPVLPLACSSIFPLISFLLFWFGEFTKHGPVGRRGTRVLRRVSVQTLPSSTLPAGRDLPAPSSFADPEKAKHVRMNVDKDVAEEARIKNQISFAPATSSPRRAESPDGMSPRTRRMQALSTPMAEAPPSMFKSMFGWQPLSGADDDGEEEEEEASGIFDLIAGKVTSNQRYSTVQATAAKKKNDSKLEMQILERIAEFPEEARWVHRATGDIALHHAMAPKVVKKLLEVYPEGAMLQNHAGLIPLHNAASPEVAKILLDAYPEGIRTATDNGHLPLHSVCEKSRPKELVELIL